MPGNRAKADLGVVFADFVELEIHIAGREHDPAQIDAGLHRSVSVRQGGLNRHCAGVFQPLEVQACTGNFLAFEVGDFVPFKIGAQVIAIVGNQGEQLLIELVLQHLGHVGHFVKDAAHQRDAFYRVHGAEGQHDLKGMQRQVGGLEAEIIAADVDDAGLHPFKGVGHFNDGAAVAFDEFDFVLGAGGDALHDLGNEKVLHEGNVGIGRRVTRGDTQLDVLGSGRGQREHDGQC